MILSAARLPVCLEQRQLIQGLCGSLPAHCTTAEVRHSSEKELKIKDEEAKGTAATSLGEIIPVPKRY